MDAKKEARIYAEIARAREKLERGDTLTEREWMLVQYDSQGCHCGRG